MTFLLVVVEPPFIFARFIRFGTQCEPEACDKWHWYMCKQPRLLFFPFYLSRQFNHCAIVEMK